MRVCNHGSNSPFEHFLEQSVQFFLGHFLVVIFICDVHEIAGITHRELHTRAAVAQTGVDEQGHLSELQEAVFVLVVLLEETVDHLTQLLA